MNVPQRLLWVMKSVFVVLMVYMEFYVNRRKPRAAMPPYIHDLIRSTQLYFRS